MGTKPCCKPFLWPFCVDDGVVAGDDLGDGGENCGLGGGHVVGGVGGAVCKVLLLWRVGGGLWWDLLPSGVGWLHDGWVEHHVCVRIVDAVVC